jgi:hypothetical protein
MKFLVSVTATTVVLMSYTLIVEFVFPSPMGAW